MNHFKIPIDNSATVNGLLSELMSVKMNINNSSNKLSQSIQLVSLHVLFFIKKSLISLHNN